MYAEQRRGTLERLQKEGGGGKEGRKEKKTRTRNLFDISDASMHVYAHKYLFVSILLTRKFQFFFFFLRDSRQCLFE